MSLPQVPNSISIGSAVLYSLRLNSTTRTRPDPRGPARTLSETRTDPAEFLGDLGRKKVRAGPVGSGRARVVEFSYYQSPPRAPIDLPYPPVGANVHPSYMRLRAPANPHAKRHVDCSIRFCRAHGRDQQTDTHTV